MLDDEVFKRICASGGNTDRAPQQPAPASSAQSKPPAPTPAPQKGPREKKEKNTKKSKSEEKANPRLGPLPPGGGAGIDAANTFGALHAGQPAGLGARVWAPGDPLAQLAQQVFSLGVQDGLRGSLSIGGLGGAYGPIGSGDTDYGFLCGGYPGFRGRGRGSWGWDGHGGYGS